MEFWLTRDFDGADPQSPYGHISLTFSSAINNIRQYAYLPGYFSTSALEQHTFYVNQTLTGPFYIHQAGGEFPLVPTSQPVRLPIIPKTVRTIACTIMSSPQISSLIRVLMGTRVIGSWKVLSPTRHTTNQNEHWVYNGWSSVWDAPFVHYEAITHHFQFRLPPDRQGGTFTLVAPDGSDTQVSAQNPTTEATVYFDPWHFEDFDGTADVWGTDFVLSNAATGRWKLQGASPSDFILVTPGENDLQNWHSPPVAAQLQISLTRWDHTLTLRCSDGSEYPITKQFTQGQLTVALAEQQVNWQSAYYFEASSFKTPGARLLGLGRHHPRRIRVEHRQFANVVCRAARVELYRHASARR
jgi:hypothetical protein